MRRNFICLRQLNKVTFELVLKQRIVPLAENGEGRECTLNRDNSTMVGNQTASPRSGENLGSPGVWGTRGLGGKVVYEGS